MVRSWHLQSNVRSDVRIRDISRFNNTKKSGAKIRIVVMWAKPYFCPFDFSYGTRRLCYHRTEEYKTFFSINPVTIVADDFRFQINLQSWYKKTLVKNVMLLISLRQFFARRALTVSTFSWSLASGRLSCCLLGTYHVDAQMRTQYVGSWRA